MSVAREMNGILFGFFFLKRLVADVLRDKVVCMAYMGMVDTTDLMSCSFLWGDTEQHRSCHTVSWETVTMPIEAGGLDRKSVV